MINYDKNIYISNKIYLNLFVKLSLIVTFRSSLFIEQITFYMDFINDLLLR